MRRQSHFSPELFAFLAELSQNNNREWFLENRDRYLAVVRDPFLRFIADFSLPLSSISPFLVADPRPTGGSMFRIYRDTRFSADKTPYKTHAAAHFTHSKAGRDVHAPGYYLHLEPGGSFAAAGIWRPDLPTTTKIRHAIVSQPEAWRKIRRNGLNIEGETLSRPPKGFDPGHPFMDDLKHKDFVTSVAFTDRQVCRPRFLVDVLEACRNMSPLMEFLAKALQLPWESHAGGRSGRAL